VEWPRDPRSRLEDESSPGYNSASYLQLPTLNETDTFQARGVKDLLFTALKALPLTAGWRLGSS